jgi:hypothetical protein
VRGARTRTVRAAGRYHRVGGRRGGRRYCFRHTNGCKDIVPVLEARNVLPKGTMAPEVEVRAVEGEAPDGGLMVSEDGW